MATIIEKIFENHTSDGSTVQPGNVVWLGLDVRTARDFAGASVVHNYRTQYGGAPVADKEKSFFTFDLVVPPNNIPYANNQQTCREWAAGQGIRVFDVNAGIGSHVVIEQGLAYPGVTLVGTDSHLNILGAIGAFGQGMGDQDIAFAFRTGRTWFEVPETMRIVVSDSPDYPFTARDLTLAVLRRLGPRGALGRARESRVAVASGREITGRNSPTGLSYPAAPSRQ